MASKGNGVVRKVRSSETLRVVLLQTGEPQDSEFSLDVLGVVTIHLFVSSPNPIKFDICYQQT